MHTKCGKVITLQSLFMEDIFRANGDGLDQPARTTMTNSRLCAENCKPELVVFLGWFIEFLEFVVLVSSAAFPPFLLLPSSRNGGRKPNCQGGLRFVSGNGVGKVQPQHTLNTETQASNFCFVVIQCSDPFVVNLKRIPRPLFNSPLRLRLLVFGNSSSVLRVTPNWTGRFVRSQILQS